MRRLRAALSGIAVVVAAYLVLLAIPYPLFAYQASLGNVTVYSDHPIPATIAAVLSDAEERLVLSPLNDTRIAHRVFICNDQWQFRVFANYKYKVGGINYALLNRNIFLLGD